MHRSIARLALLFALAGCVAAPTEPPARFSFALFGDVPYSRAQARVLDELIDQMNAAPLAFAVHVGDITSGAGPCSDAWLEARRRQFARIRHPFVLLPGDNEWTDCHRAGFDPLERLARWRSLFCGPVPGLDLVRQGGASCENVRWQAGGFVFVGVNVPGSNNNLGRSARMDAEHARRMRAVFAWLDEAKALTRPGALVVLMQGDPMVEPRRGPDGYRALRAWLRRAAADASLRLTLVHGDTHVYRDDHPWPGLHRIEVPGSPQVRWLRAFASAGRLSTEAHDPPLPVWVP
jgi:hypothetical protein